MLQDYLKSKSLFFFLSRKKKLKNSKFTIYLVIKMGTRGLIRIYDLESNKKKHSPIATIYIQYDMYPKLGTMCLLIDYLKDRKVVNGITKHFSQINGMEDLASIAISYMKYLNTIWELKSGLPHERPSKVPPISAGFAYLVPNDFNIKDSDVEYVYRLYPPDGYEKLYDIATVMESGTKLEIPFTELRIKAYRYDWSNNKLKQIFNGTIGEFYEKYCKAD